MAARDKSHQIDANRSKNASLDASLDASRSPSLSWVGGGICALALGVQWLQLGGAH